MLAQGQVRNAAEKAWGATKRASDALILARDSGDRVGTPAAGVLGRSSPTSAPGPALLHPPQGLLHGECFYNGLCVPPWKKRSGGSGRRPDYIEDAELRAEGEHIYVAYVPLFRDYGFVRPEVMVEFGARSIGEPRQERLANATRPTIYQMSFSLGPPIRHVGRADSLGKGDCIPRLLSPAGDSGSPGIGTTW